MSTIALVRRIGKGGVSSFTRGYELTCYISRMNVGPSPSKVSDAVLPPTHNIIARSCSSVTALIDSVHNDGPLPKQEVKVFKRDPDLGGLYDPSTKEIWLNEDSSELEETVCHEIGHLLDFEGFGSGYSAASLSPEFDEWRTELSGHRRSSI